jgi:hypothetical protein
MSTSIVILKKAQCRKLDQYSKIPQTSSFRVNTHLFPFTHTMEAAVQRIGNNHASLASQKAAVAMMAGVTNPDESNGGGGRVVTDLVEVMLWLLNRRRRLAAVSSMTPTQ